LAGHPKRQDLRKAKARTHPLRRGRAPRTLTTHAGAVFVRLG
jgi:hypothetical protein